MNHLNGKNEEDRRIYERSARLILLLALRDIAPGAKARFEHSIGLGLYLNVSGVSLTASLVRKIEARMREISKADLPIVKSRWTREQALALTASTRPDLIEKAKAEGKLTKDDLAWLKSHA